ncbi:integrase catalytic domain-containing protein [Trichonephila clavipes]|nr:integrase catalytic domain-containing protein [Trichonephila clavipes]
MHWPLAKVIRLIPGKDGKIRTVELKTRTGTMLRPIQRVYPLEVQSTETPNDPLNDCTITNPISSISSDNLSDPNDSSNVLPRVSKYGSVIKVPEKLDLSNQDFTWPPNRNNLKRRLPSSNLSNQQAKQRGRWTEENNGQVPAASSRPGPAEESLLQPSPIQQGRSSAYYLRNRAEQTAWAGSRPAEEIMQAKEGPVCSRRRSPYNLQHRCQSRQDCQDPEKSLISRRSPSLEVYIVDIAEETLARTVTAGSDVVQSGRQIFYDFFQQFCLEMKCTSGLMATSTNKTAAFGVSDSTSVCGNTVTSRKTDCLVRFMGWWNPSSKTMKATTLQLMVIGTEP